MDPAGGKHALEDVQWATWTADGRPLVAAEAGELQVRDEPTVPDAAWSTDLAALTPSREPPPAEARHW